VGPATGRRLTGARPALAQQPGLDRLALELLAIECSTMNALPPFEYIAPRAKSA